MSVNDFENSITMTGPRIEKIDTYLRKAIPVKIRLAVMLRFYMYWGFLYKPAISF